MANRVYSKSTGVISTFNLPKGIKQLGYDGTDVPEEYLVTIHDERPDAYIANISNAITEKHLLIKAPLQEQFGTRTEATWQPLSAASFLSGLTGLSQILTGRTLVSRYASRRMWTGTSPLDFTLNLKFEAINDVYNEVLYPIIELQRMSLPFSGHKQQAEFGVHEFLAESFLAPPGPDPFVIGGKNVREHLTKIKRFKGIYENITVRIGTLLEIKKVVVKDIQIQLQPKLTEDGVPVEANVAVHFQTFEIVTKESLDDIYVGGTFGTFMDVQREKTKLFKERWGIE